VLPSGNKRRLCAQNVLFAGLWIGCRTLHTNDKQQEQHHHAPTPATAWPTTTHHLSSLERDTRHDAQPPPATQPCRRRVLCFGSSNHACALVTNDVSSTTSPCALHCSDGSDGDCARADTSRVARVQQTSHKLPPPSLHPPLTTSIDLFSLPTMQRGFGELRSNPSQVLTRHDGIRTHSCYSHHAGNPTNTVPRDDGWWIEHGLPPSPHLSREVDRWSGERVWCDSCANELDKSNILCSEFSIWIYCKSQNWIRISESIGDKSMQQSTGKCKTGAVNAYATTNLFNQLYRINMCRW
jgi:hypothetical protein